MGLVDGPRVIDKRRNKILFNIFKNSNKLSTNDRINLKKLDEVEKQLKELELKIDLYYKKIEEDKHNEFIIDSTCSNQWIFLDEGIGRVCNKYKFNLIKDGSLEINEALNDSTIKTTIIRSQDVKLLLTLLDHNREILGE